MVELVIGLGIVGYTAYLVYRQVKNFKEGNYCGSCSGCPSAKSCGKLKDISK